MAFLDFYYWFEIDSFASFETMIFFLCRTELGMLSREVSPLLGILWISLTIPTFLSWMIYDCKALLLENIMRSGKNFLLY